MLILGTCIKTSSLAVVVVVEVSTYRDDDTLKFSFAARAPRQVDLEKKKKETPHTKVLKSHKRG